MNKFEHLRGEGRGDVRGKALKSWTLFFLSFNYYFINSSEFKDEFPGNLCHRESIFSMQLHGPFIDMLPCTWLSWENAETWDRLSCDSLSKALNLMSWFIEHFLTIGAWTAILPWTTQKTRILAWEWEMDRCIREQNSAALLPLLLSS